MARRRSTLGRKMVRAAVGDLKRRGRKRGRKSQIKA